MKNLFLFALLSFALTSCISNTAMQTGRVLEKGQVQITAAISDNIIKENNSEGIINSSSNDDDLTFGSADILGRVKVGLGSKTDIGIGASLINIFVGNIEAEIKHQFIGDKKSPFAMSAGLKYSSQGFGWKSRQFTAPLYASYHLNDMFAFYSSPRYIRMNTEGNKQNFFGLVNGINVSVNNLDLYLESGIVDGGDDKMLSTTIGTAFKF